MNNNQQILGTEPIGKLLLRYSLPAIIGMMVNGLYNVVDRIFIGNIPGVGTMAIAGLGVTMPILTILLAFGMLVGVGSATNVSIKLGQGKKEEAQNIIGSGMILTITIGLFLTVIGILFSNQILNMFGASDATLYYAKSYTNIIMLGAVFNISAMFFNNVIRGDGNPKLSAIIMAVGCFTNIVLDAIFIFGFNMGIQGAATATIISQALTAIWGLLYYIKKSNLEFRKETLRFNSPAVKSILAIGISPFSMQTAASMVQVISNQSLRLYGGDLAIGAMTAISTIGLMFMMPVFGITQGVQTIIGYNYGAKKLDRCRKALLLSVFAATVILIIGFLLVELTPKIMISIFNRDESLMNIAVYGIRIYLMTLPILGIVIIGPSYFQAIGKAKHSMVLSLLRQCILLIPLILVLPKAFNLTGVWFVQPIADIISAIIIVVFLAGEFKNFRT